MKERIPHLPAVKSKSAGWPLAAALAVVGFFLYQVREVFLPFVIAAALSFVLAPIVDGIHHSLGRLPRWVAAALVYLLVLVSVGGIGFWVAPLVAADFSDFAAHLPEMAERLLGSVAPHGQFMLLGQTIRIDTVTADAIAAARTALFSGAGLTIASTGVAVLLATILTVVLLAYFLVSGDDLARGLLWLVPPDHRAEVRHLAAIAAPILRRYFAGLAVIVAYTILISWIVFAWIAGMSHAPLFAVTIGLLEVIPFFGPAMSVALITIAALQQNGIVMMVCLGAFAGGLRLSIDQIVGPLVLGRATYLHPAAVIFAFLTGAVFLGALGLVLAVPVAATIKVVLSHYYERRLTVS